MKINVYGTDYLACLYATYLASNGHQVGREHIDIARVDPEVKLREVYMKQNFSWIQSDPDLNWFCVDTRIDCLGGADIVNLLEEFEDINPNAPIFISSQIPLGTFRQMEKIFPSVKMAYIPENVRVGKGWDYLTKAGQFDRWVIGTRYMELANLLRDVLPYSMPIYRTTPESAEMIKHTINCFLATCIAFANEIGEVCKQNGVSVDGVIEGFRSEGRVGEKLPLIPGGPFKSGHLERDLNYVNNLVESAFDIPLLDVVLSSNARHAERCK